MKKLLFSLLVACGMVFFCSGAWAWQTNISGTPMGSGLFHAVTVDGAGNAVAAGFIENAGTVNDFTVVKFDGASGAELWRRVIDGTSSGNDEARAVTVDGAGNVIVAGVTINTGTSSDFTVVKFDGASGTELWRRVINGTANGSDEARAVAVDGGGNVIAAGVTNNTGTGDDFTVVKFDGASGVELWRQVIDGTTSHFIFINDEANAVTVDRFGNVVAAGRTSNDDIICGITSLPPPCPSVDFTVVKFEGVTGVELWRRTIDGGANSFDEATAVTVDGVGNVVAAGSIIPNILNADFAVVKFEGVTGIELWRRTVSGAPDDHPEDALAVTVDGAGDVVAAGFTRNNSTDNTAFTVVKFNGASGLELWRQVIRGSATGIDAMNRALAVGVDGGGNVVAVGSIVNTVGNFAVLKFQGTNGAELWRQLISAGVARAVTVDGAGKVIAAGDIGGFAALVKFGAGGEELWRQTVAGTASGSDSASAVAVDGAGDVVAAGSTSNIGTGSDFTVVKVDRASGVELWRQVINGTASGDDEAVAVEVDGTGNAVAAGFIENAGTANDFTVVKFDGASGAELWRRVISGTANGNDEARAVAVDGAGNVIAAGRTNNIGTGFADLIVVKFDGASGVELWRQMINGSANGSDEASAIAVDGLGNVVAAGLTQNLGTGFDFTVVKFDGTSGGELWRRVINGSANSFDAANAVAVDDAGNVVAAGSTHNIGGDFPDFTVVKLDGASGAELWRRVINGSANAVAIDGLGNVMAAGRTSNTGTGDDYTVIKFDGASGVELWRQVINGSANRTDVALAVALDGAGNAVAAGFIENAGTANDFTVVKLDGASGAELWRRVIDGTTSGNDFFDVARAVAVDGAGDVIAAGSTQNIGASSDFTVVKLRGTDGGDDC